MLLKSALPIVYDSLGVIVFAVLVALKVDLVVTTCIAVVAAIAVVAWPLLRGRPAAALQWISLGLVIIGAAATLFTHDMRFLMAKPSVIYAVIGAAMLQRGWMLRYVPPRAVELAEDLIVTFGYVWAGLMFLTGALNAVVAVALPARWPLFIAVFPAASKVLLFLVQYRIVFTTARRRATQPAAA